MARTASNNNSKGTSKSAKKASAASSKNGPKVTKETLILQAMVQERNMGVEAPARQRIASLIEMTGDKMGSFKTFCGILKRKGLIDYDKETMWFREAGLEQMRPELAAAPKTNEEYHARVMETIKMKRGRDIFQFLADGRTRSFSEIAAAIGVDESNASLKTYLTSVTKFTDKSNGPNGEKMFRLNDGSFPFGRPVPADNP